MKFILLYSLFAASFIKHDSEKLVATSTQAYYLIDTSIYAVVRFEPSLHYMFDKTSKNLRLSDLDFKAIQELLERGVGDYNIYVSKDTLYKGIKKRWLDLSDYKRQLIAVTNNKGEKEIFVSCICASAIPDLYKSGINWRKEYFRVNDGGPCYFRVFLNLTTGQYHNFQVNGYGWQKHAYNMNCVKNQIKKMIIYGFAEQ